MIEQIIAQIAPHHCKNCHAEGDLLCDGCLPEVTFETTWCCFRHNITLNQSTFCPECQSPAELLWIAGEYEGLLADLIHDFKFERAQAAARPLAKVLASALPYFEDVVIVPIATAPQRRRIRGYDQTHLLAQELSTIINQPYLLALARNHNLRQVGATRPERFKQAVTALRVAKPKDVAGRHILLIDDVLTTGATLQSAARLLREAGAASVQAAVIARQGLPQRLTDVVQ